MGWFVYILRCVDGTLYTGITTDVARRLAQHNSGRGSRYVAQRVPAVVVHLEPAPDRSAASRREHELKSLSRADKLALLAGDGRGS